MSMFALSTDPVADVDYAVLCGACPNTIAEHFSMFAVIYNLGVVNEHGDAAPERLFTCATGLGDTVSWAMDHHHSFVPPTVHRLTPYCPFCGAAWFECDHDARGLCAKRVAS